MNQYVKELLFLEYLILSVYLKSVGLAFAALLLFIFWKNSFRFFNHSQADLIKRNVDVDEIGFEPMLSVLQTDALPTELFIHYCLNQDLRDLLD